MPCNPFLLKSVGLLFLTLISHICLADNQPFVDSLAKQLSLEYEVITNDFRSLSKKNAVRKETFLTQEKNPLLETVAPLSETVDCAVLGAQWGLCYEVSLSLTNKGPEIQFPDWELYFHSIRRFLEIKNSDFQIEHITGDLYRLTPTETFDGFQQDEKITIPLIFEYYQLLATDVMPRWYITAPQAAPKIIETTKNETDPHYFAVPITGENWKRSSKDHNILKTPQTRYLSYHKSEPLPPQRLRGTLIPTPKNQAISEENTSLSDGLSISIKGLSETQIALLKEKLDSLGITVLDEQETSYHLKAHINPEYFFTTEAKPESYALYVNKQETQLIGYDASGLFYAFQSFLALIDPQTKDIPLTRIVDSPRFLYRGMHVDLARNFIGAKPLFKLIDQMGTYKLNKLHLHLSDDEGWRLEIPGLPELTEVGAKRCHDLTEQSCLLPQLGSGPFDNNSGSGYLSVEEYKEILLYAKDREIEVIPEFDMPGHARAAVMSMEARYNTLMNEGDPKAAAEFRLLDPGDTSHLQTIQFYNRQSLLNPCLPSSLNFISKIIDEVQTLHQDVGVPLKTWHIGGDEAKNIKLGAGFQDKNSTELTNAEGLIDKSIEDAPWAKSPACHTLLNKEADATTKTNDLLNYFIRQLREKIQSKGIESAIVWQDALKNTPSKKGADLLIQAWEPLFWGGQETATHWADKGFKTILSTPEYLYFDMPYEVDPEEPGYYWASRETTTQKVFSFSPFNLAQNAELSFDRDGNSFSLKTPSSTNEFYGMQGFLWGETVRTPENFDYMVYPRLLALAERAWHQASWELPRQEGQEFEKGKTSFTDETSLFSDWTLFINKLAYKEFPKLDKQNIHYRLPVPGAQFLLGLLKVNSPFPSMPIQYSSDQGENWEIYDDEMPPYFEQGDEVWLRTTSFDGKRFGRMTKLHAN